MFRPLLSALSALLLLAATHQAQASEPPKVVVSVAPIHSLAAGVMQGVAEPGLLLRADTSPHHTMLKPSQMFSLQRADLVVWVGESVESFLPQVLESLGDEVQVMELMRLPGMTLYPARAGGAWEPQAVAEHEDEHRHEQDGHAHGAMDGHLWLDPHNARRTVRALVQRLSDMDPEHAARYRANGEQLQQRLDALDEFLAQTLTPLQGIPYLLFHDGYQYLERRYGLQPMGALMIDPERKPGARRLSEIRQRIAAQGVRCIFSEPQFPDKLSRLVSEGNAVETATLDPMGMGLPPGPELYFQLMRQMAHTLSQCLK